MPRLGPWLRNAAASLGDLIGSIATATAEAVAAVFRRRYRPICPDRFAAIQAVINRLGWQDQEVHSALARELPELPAEDKDRLIVVLVMTLRVQAKKDRLRQRALAIFGQRIRTVGNRLCRFPV